MSDDLTDDLIMAGLVGAMLGCEWGRRISDPREIAPACTERAVQSVVLHEGEVEAHYKLCAKHRDLVLKATDPRVD